MFPRCLMAAAIFPLWICPVGKEKTYLISLACSTIAAVSKALTFPD